MGTIEITNALSLEEFKLKYFSSLDSELPFITPYPRGTRYEVVLESAASLNGADFANCFNLIQETSGEMYKSSSVGWSASKKKKEMRLPEMRYLLVKGPRAKSTREKIDSSDAGKAANARAPVKHEVAHRVVPDTYEIYGFLSFMLTYEDGKEVIYCYELHLSASLRRLGLGKNLMGFFEKIGARAGVEKAMLTVFLDNEIGVKFYESLGYSEDEYSPAPKRLRNGKVKTPSYVILSKALR